MKKLVVGIVMVFCISLVGCGSSGDGVSQKMVDDINALGDITLEDETEIEKLIDRYATLTDEQKAAVKNYVDLLDAQDKIEEIKNGKEAEESAEKDAVLNKENTQVALAVVKQLKKQLKHPDTLKLYDVQTIKGNVDGIDQSVILVLVDYEADNDMGGSIRHSDTIGVGGFADGSCAVFNRDDGGVGDEAYNLYLIYHNAWMKNTRENPDSVESVDIDVINDNI